MGFIFYLIESGYQKAAHNLLAGKRHKAGAAFVTLKEN